MCIIRDKSGRMVGRINFGSIKRNELLRADMGYRISECEQCKGYASEAVRLIIEEGIKKFGVEVIEAGTSTINIGSQKVLVKNGFDQVGKERNVIKINGEWVDGFLYEKWIR